MLKWLCFFLTSLLLSPLPAAPVEEARAKLEQWMKTASQVRTVQAEFEQLRLLSTVRVPLRKQGQLWTDKSGFFRWQIGEPPTLVVLREKSGQLTVLEPKNKKARVLSKEALLNEEKQGRGQGFAMLQAMQAPTMEEFEKSFEIKEATQKAEQSGLWEFELALKDRQASVFVTQVRLTLNMTQGTLVSFAIQMRDGSNMTTNIRSARLNEVIPASFFKVDTTGYDMEAGS